MTLTFCKIFHTIIQQGNFLKAAEVLHMTPSAVSHAVSDAEKQVGFRFFTRMRGGVKMTECGESLYPEILQLLSREESLEQSIDQIRGLERGVAKVGIFNSTCTNWMPEILESFGKQFPKIQVDIYEGGYDDVVRWIKTGLVEFGLISTSCTSELPVEPIYRDPLICIVPPDFKTKTPGIITIDEMKNQHFVIQSAGSDWDVQELFKKYDLHFHSNCHVLDDTSIMTMVSCGRGISIMAKLTAKGLEGDLRVLRLLPEEHRIIALSAINKDLLSPASKQLYMAIRDYARNLPESQGIIL